MYGMKFNKKDHEEFMATNPQIMFATTKPYITGAKIQLERYLEAQRIMKTHRTVFSGGMDKCTYELSSLLEHLDTIESQLRSRGIKLPAGEKIRQFRNHLRHDGRGDTDHSKGKRSEAIGLDQRSQFHLSFSDSGVKMGTTELTAQQMDTFITMAETIMWTMLLGGNIKIEGEAINIFQQSVNIKVA